MVLRFKEDQTLKIASRLKDYDVILENDLTFLQNLIKKRNAQFVIDQKVYCLYQAALRDIPQDRLMLVEATEERKVIETALEICEKITEIPAKRNAVLISIGGGIIQDITGFVANITYRGIHWIFVPTTLLAACDSCIGGKTSLNYKRYKNLLGTFFPPDEIHICPDFLRTLSERDYKSGLGEVVKFNIMAGQTGLSGIECRMEKLLERDSQTVLEYVRSSLSFKKRFIEADEFDHGERIKLNFAHTFGHAIEVVSDYAIPHGTAVAIGMIMADRISVKREILDADVAQRAEQVLLQVITIDSSPLKASTEEFLAAMRKDKKQTSSALTAVLLAHYGDAPELNIVHNIQPEEVADAVSYFLNLYEGR